MVGSDQPHSSPQLGLHTASSSSVPHFPEEDSKLRATTLQVRRGGNCPNTLEVLQQLLRHSSTETHIVPHIVSCLPAAGSPATSKILSSFGADAIANFSHCLYREGHTEPASCYIIQSQTAGTRTIVNYNDLPEMTVQEFCDIADCFRDRPQSLWHFEVMLDLRLLAEMPCISDGGC
jgi:ketohexokinase